MSDNFQIHTIPRIETESFIMNPAELHEYFDFDVKRVYFITEPKEETGSHCHLQEKEFFVLVQGSCVAEIDLGDGLEEFEMSGPSEDEADAIYVANYVWHHFKDFSDDAILLALSSTNYDPSRDDYIEDYDEYLEIRDEKLS